MLPSPDHQQLRTDLDRIARQTAGGLRRAGVRSELVRATVRFMSLLLVVPGLHVTVQVLLLVSGGSPEPMAATLLAAATLALPAAFIILAGVREWFRRIGRGRALGVCDAALALQDRLVTADEFLDRPQKTGFVAAALDDAVEHARRARDALSRGMKPFPVMTPLPPRFRPWGALAAASLFVLSLVLGSFPVEGAGVRAVAETVPFIAEVALEDGAIVDEERTVRAADAADATVPGQPPDQQTGSGESVGSPPRAQEHLDGVPVGGGAAAAGSPGKPTAAAGAPTDGGARSRGTRRGDERRSPQEARPRAGTLGVARTRDQSGSATGSGSARGARDNPMSGDRDSQQQVGAGDDRELQDEDMVQGESEDQQARGGVQPNLRDRQPSASRELQVGLGSDKDPDADGRGGPSEPKKSRGVASLVLGVPIPDLVVGQPNPGRTVVTREQIEPDREDAEARAAEVRTPRRAPPGYLPHPELTGWMRNLVRTYFLGMRTTEARAAESSREGGTR